MMANESCQSSGTEHKQIGLAAPLMNSTSGPIAGFLGKH